MLIDVLGQTTAQLHGNKQAQAVISGVGPIGGLKKKL
jgi:hypothetical protein